MASYKLQATSYKLRITRNESQGTNHEKGVILLAVLMVMMVVSIYLPAYVTWSIWDQRSLIRQQRATEARALAQAGLNRAALDLYLDDDSWLDGEINNWTVGLPASGSPDQFWTLYASQNWTLWDGSLGSYTVWIDYLQNPGSCTSGCTSFLDKRMRVRSTGTVIGALLALATSTLEQYVNYNAVRNITQNLDYHSLQLAIDEAINNNWNNNNLAITATTLNENININSILSFNINGCWDPTFSFRSCADYYTHIHGDWTVGGTADVNLSGVTID